MSLVDFLPLFILMTLDMGMTYYTVNTLEKSKLKNKNLLFDEWQEIEINSIVRFLWKKFGMYKGTLITWVLFSWFFYIIFELTFDRFLVGMLTGAYTVVLLIHYYNINLIYEKISKETKKVRNRDCV